MGCASHGRQSVMLWESAPQIRGAGPALSSQSVAASVEQFWGQHYVQRAAPNGCIDVQSALSSQRTGAQDQSKYGHAKGE